jgi:hypothetical protein
VLKLLLFFIPFYELLRLLVVIALFYPKNGFALKIYRLAQNLKHKYLLSRATTTSGSS